MRVTQLLVLYCFLKVNFKHSCPHTYTHIHTMLPTTTSVLWRRRVKPKCHLMSAKVTGCDWDPEGDLTWFNSEVTGPTGYDLSIPWFHPSHQPGCPLHGRFHLLLSKTGTWWRTLPCEVRDPLVTQWSHLCVCVKQCPEQTFFQLTCCSPIRSCQTGTSG